MFMAYLRKSSNFRWVSNLWTLIFFITLGFFPIMAHSEKVSRGQIDEKTFSGIVRCIQGCALQDAIDLGMRPTGSQPTFDNQFECRAIDEGWAIDYSAKRARETLHGGIDIPASRGTPIYAIADGTVVAMFDNHQSAVGVRIFIQHSPAQTGKPFWVYSEYAHLLELPPLMVGQSVKLGDEVGKTSNSGISGAEARAKAGGGSTRSRSRDSIRRDAIHFSIMYSDSADYAVLPMNGGFLVPVKGRWMDPVAIYRTNPPYDSDSLTALPDDKKLVPIPLIDNKGVVHPANSKLIWPYPCVKR